MHESGLDELEYHLENEKESLRESFFEMADQFNKASLVTLYALLEGELRRLCARLQSHFNKKVTLDRFEKDDYLKSIIEYLDSIIEIDVQTVEPYITKIKELQFFRNKIMHNGGEFNMEKFEYLEDSVKKSDGLLKLEEFPDEDLRILRVRSGYLTPFYDLIEDLMLEIFTQIDKKTNYLFTTNRLKYLFQFLTQDVNVKFLEEKAVKNGHRFVFNVELKDVEFNFHCKITIRATNKDEVLITNQLTNEVKNLQRLVDKLPESIDYVRELFNGFLKSNQPYSFEFMLYTEE